ncbi:glycosyltransferase [Amnibacterium sp. CER49]|uniref:glycosyltransferase n=1 Tax=Amnibacterium sp. CER49 TaxID=3039161 RepID=UPI002447B899|nr:glycosyltransferase [Amnibacterium sp. CER49]MDH2443055.1 glycosyltransferase [Amnibacterium sp. CER49]
MTRRTLVVSAGTDHHRFDRLIDWVEDWIMTRGADVELFVQHGTSRAPEYGEGVPMLSQEQMLERYRGADLVVTQVGPGSILDVAAAGRIPIAVPRRPDLGEHVDSHQIVFGRFMASTGDAILAEDEPTFFDALDAAYADPASVRRVPRAGNVDETARELGRVVEDVLSRPAGFVNWSRLRRGRGAARPLGKRQPAAVPVPIALPVPLDAVPQAR